MLIFSKLQISFKILQFKIVKYQIKYIFALLIYNIMTNLLESTEIYERLKEWQPFYEQLPSGTIYWKVKCYDGDGNFYGADYTLDSNNLESMQSVSDGYFTETYKCIKK